MKEEYKSLAWWQFCGFCIVALLGSLLHFLFEWSNENIVIAPFSAVNESTWEHMKIMFFPSLVFAIVETRYLGKKFDNFLWIKTLGILTATFSIPFLFYTLNGAFGKTPDWVNVLLFFVANGLAFGIEYLLITKGNLPSRKKWLPITILILVGFLFVLFTFATPKLPLFVDPTTGEYGIS